MFASRLLRPGDDRGSMPVAMLVSLVAMSLSAGLAGLVTNQLNNTKAEADRVAAVAAAQAGLDAGLARIRRAVVNTLQDWTGVLNQLPCSEVTSGVIPKSGNGVSSSAQYSTSYLFFLVNPASALGPLVPLGDLSKVSDMILSPSLLNNIPGVDKSALAPVLNTALPCSGVGKTLQQVPLYALMRSSAKVGGVTRTLYATYQVRTTEEALDGGHLIVQGTSGKLCIGAAPGDLTKATPPAPWNVYAVSCTADPNSVSFIYPKNLTLSLSKTRTNLNAPQPYPYGLCITTPTLPKDGDPVTFAQCMTGRNATQMFSYDVNNQTYYSAYASNALGVVTTTTTALQASNSATAGNFCLSADSTKTPPIIVLRFTSTYCGSAGRAYMAFVPEATVGAGGAGVGSQQFVNFAEVGRCLDLTNENVNAATNAAKALITYPCKQSFSGVPYWNHRWYSPTVPPCYTKVPRPVDCPASPTADSNSGQIYTIPASGTYANQKWCMFSPGVNGGYVWVKLCSATDPEQVWTVYGASTDASKAYRVMDMYGNCLMAGASLGYTYSSWSYVITSACDGKDQQKWNAPRSFKVSPLSGIQEK